MADKMENRAARLQGRRKAPNAGVLAGVALVTGLAAGGAGVTYWKNLDQGRTGPVLDTSDSREFPRDANDGLTPVIAPEFTPTEQGPSEAERALRARVAELERILDEARNQTPSAPVVDTERLELLQAQLDALSSDMESREAEMSRVISERDALRRDVLRQQTELEGLEMRLRQADDASL